MTLTQRLLLILSLTALLGGRAWASPEDLKREIDAQRAATADFDRLDETRTVTDEITNLRSWLDEASALHAKEEWDRVREVLDRCVAQAELIRQKTTAAKLIQQMRARQGALKSSRAKVEQTKQALLQSQVKKKALEMNSR